MAGLLVVLIIAGCVAYQYLKGTFVKSFVTIITIICAGIVAFAYFELLAKILISRDLVIPWAQSVSFILLLILAFAVFQTAVSQLIPRKIDLGFLPERIGRAVCGIFSGIIISGLLLTTLAMAPLPSKYPYQRFDRTNPDAEKPDKVLLNADCFATGWFNLVSKGSFSGKRSFAVLHPDFLDQAFLNRHKEDIPIITTSKAITVPSKKAFWAASESLKDSKDPNNPIEPKTGYDLTIVRVGIKKSALKDGGTFTLSQLRLICKQKDDIKKTLAGSAKNIYAIGYLKTANLLQTKKLNDRINIDRTSFTGSAKWMDFAFYVPNDLSPVLIEFKQNNVAKLPPPTSSE